MELLILFVLVIFASFFQGTFGLGMKYIKPLAWEAWWQVRLFVAIINIACIILGYSNGLNWIFL